jgi:hypothetical protein
VEALRATWQLDGVRQSKQRALWDQCVQALSSDADTPLRRHELRLGLSALPSLIWRDRPSNAELSASLHSCSLATDRWPEPYRKKTSCL